MTDRISSLTVVLDQDYREDDIETLINAIKLFGNVLDVVPGLTDPSQYIAERRVKTELQCKLWEVLYPKVKE